MATVRGGITVKPHVQRFADACQAATGADSYGTYNGHSPPEGPTQALDIFNPDNAGGYALQDRIVNFAMANQKRFGIRYIIRRRQIWNVERDGEGWRNQGVTGNRTADHYDHVHITFYAKAAVEPTPPPHPVPQPEEPEVAKVAYPLQVDAGERRKLPILAIGGGFGWTKASVTFASTGVEVRRAVVGPNERPIEHLSPDPGASSRRFDGRWYVDLRAGDEWVEVELGTGEGAGVLDLYVEAADG